jgi:hypothetical protein
LNVSVLYGNGISIPASSRARLNFGQRPAHVRGSRNAGHERASGFNDEPREHEKNQRHGDLRQCGPEVRDELPHLFGQGRIQPFFHHISRSPRMRHLGAASGIAPASVTTRQPRWGSIAPASGPTLPIAISETYCRRVQEPLRYLRVK